jgi:hypothetical protein
MGRHHFDRISFAVDGDGRSLLAYVGRDAQAPNGMSVFVTTFAAGQWTTPQRIASPDGYPEFPRLAVAIGQRVYLTYFVRDKEFEAGHYTVWVVSGESDARAIPAQAAAALAPPAPTRVPVPAWSQPLRAYPTITSSQPLEVEPGARFETPLHVVSQPAIRALESTALGLAMILPLSFALRYVWRRRA